MDHQTLLGILRPLGYKGRMLMLGAILALLPAVGAGSPAEAAPAISVLEPVKNMDVKWLQQKGSWHGATPIVTGSTISLDLSGHTNWLTDPTMPVSAQSLSTGVTAEIEGTTLKVNVLSAGKANIQLKAEKPGQTPMVDTLQFDITLIGDTNGDGTVSSADALYIMKIVNAKAVLTLGEINRYDINRDGVVTAADSTALLNKYISKTGATTVSYIANILEVNDPPVVLKASIEGKLAIHEVLTAHYLYGDAEGDAEAAIAYQWYRGSLADGSDKIAIPGGVQNHYTVTAGDVEAYLFVEVTPAAATGALEGDPIQAVTAIAVPDTTPPELAQLPAPAGALNAIQSGEDFVLTFTEPVKAGSGSITLHKTSDHSVISTYPAQDANHVTITGNRITISNPGLQDLTGYYITVDSEAVTDLTGNPYAGLSSTTDWAFTVSDRTAPAAVSMIPSAGSLTVLPDSGLTIIFDEDISAVPGKNITLYHADGTVAEVFVAADSSKVHIQQQTVTVNLQLLSEFQRYYVEIDAGAFRDQAGNEFAGLTGQTEWSFQVADVTAPHIAAFSPSFQAIQVLPGSELKLEFNEDVVAAENKSITIYNVSDQLILETIAANDTGRVAVNGRDVTVSGVGLISDKVYEINVDAGAFTDTSGNPAAAVTGTSQWIFAMTDTVAPLLQTLAPAPGGISPGQTADLSMTFNEKVKAVAGKSITILKSIDQSEVYTFTADNSAHVIINDHSVTFTGLQLEEDTGYYVLVEPGAFEDLADNPYGGIAGSQDWSFHVADLTPPVAQLFTPAASSQTASMTGSFTVTFDENVAAVPGKTVKIVKSQDQSVIASYNTTDPSRVSINGSTVTIHNPGLADGTAYGIVIEAGAFEDEAGNPFAGTAAESWSFSTPDTIGPALLTTSPVNLAAGVSKVTPFSISFNETIQAAAGKVITIRNLDTDTDAAVYSADDASKVILNGAMATIVNPGLQDFQTYAVQVEAGAFMDASGNPSDAASWSFTTPDTRVFSAMNLAEDFSMEQMLLDGGAVLQLEVEGDSFTGSLNETDIQLHNAPAGLTIMGAVYTDSQNAALFLNYDGTSFEGEITTFSISVLGTGMVSNKPVQAANMTIKGSQGPKVVTFAPAHNGINADKRGDLTITFDKNVSGGVSGKNVTVFQSSNDSIEEIIDAADSTKVAVNGSTVTIKPGDLADLASYYVTVDAGAFSGTQGGASPAIGGKQVWNFTTAEAIPGPFFSEYLDAGDGRIALEIFSSVPNANYEGYKLWVYRYVHANHTLESYSLDLYNTWQNNMMNIIISSTFYDAMDVTNIWYYNDEIQAYDPSRYTLNALVIKDSTGKTIDVLGDPVTAAPNQFLPAGGTLVRKPQSFGGSFIYNPNQWSLHPKGAFQFLGTHQN